MAGKPPNPHEFCPRCGQIMRVLRLDTTLPPLKARIVDAVMMAGEVGITAAELRDEIYRDYPATRAIKTIGVHLWQVNQELELEDSAWRIRCDGGRWYLVQRWVRQRRA